MANSQQITRHLKQLLKSKNNYAVALTGEWGIGKTHFWKSFYREHNTDFNTDKYAYVSLFGISSLNELKLKIATEIHSKNTQDDSLLNSDGGKFLKKLATNFIPKGGIELGNSGVALNLSSSLISNLIVKDLKGALICLDDAERLSKGLSINEVMGLVNYLKSEKNCTVIFILHQDKSEEERTFEEYKEKVFDEVVLLDECLDVALSLFDDSYHEIISDFYETFKIKNIRFYQSVCQKYQKFLQLVESKDLSDTSKIEILKTVLILWAFISMPMEMGFDLDKLVKDYSGRNYVLQNKAELDKNIEVTESEKSTKQAINQFYRYFKFSDWQKVIKDYLIHFDVGNKAYEIIEKDKFSESQLKKERAYKSIAWEEFHSLDLKPDFAIRLYKALTDYLEHVSYQNISFWCELLEGFGQLDYVLEIENKTHKIIDKRIELTSFADLKRFGRFGMADTAGRFSTYIAEKLALKAESFSEPDYQKIFTTYYEDKGWSTESDIIVLEKLDKEILRQVIWYSRNDLYYDRKNYIISVVTHPSLTQSLREKVRCLVIEILKEKAMQSEENQFVVEQWLEQTKNLTKFK